MDEAMELEEHLIIDELFLVEDEQVEPRNVEDYLV